MKDLYGYIIAVTDRDPLRVAAWALGWMNGGQEEPAMTQRAMAYHLSRVLEGEDEDPSSVTMLTDYIDRPFGPWLFEAMCGGAPGEPQTPRERLMAEADKARAAVADLIPPMARHWCREHGHPSYCGLCGHHTQEPDKYTTTEPVTPARTARDAVVKAAREVLPFLPDMPEMAGKAAHVTATETLRTALATFDATKKQP